jgi:hypothetical protein
MAQAHYVWDIHIVIVHRLELQSQASSCPFSWLMARQGHFGVFHGSPGRHDKRLLSEAEETVWTSRINEGHIEFCHVLG